MNLLPSKNLQPTVLSSDKSDAIAGMKSKLQKMQTDRPFMGTDGVARYADGSMMPQQPGLINGIDTGKKPPFET